MASSRIALPIVMPLSDGAFNLVALFYCFEAPLDIIPKEEICYGDLLVAKGTKLPVYLSYPVTAKTVHKSHPSIHPSIHPSLHSFIHLVKQVKKLQQ